MHSFALMKEPTPQSLQLLQKVSHPSQGASRAWSANTTQQYGMGNTGVPLTQSANFASHNDGNPSRQTANWQSSDTSHLASQSKNYFHPRQSIFLGLLLGQPSYTLTNVQNANLPVPITCMSQSAPMQSPHLNGSNHSQHETAPASSSFQHASLLRKQPVSFNEAQTTTPTDASHPQQSWKQQAFHPAANRGITRNFSACTAAPSHSYDQIVNSNTALAPATHSGQTRVAPNQIHTQRYSQCGYPHTLDPSSGMATTQSFRNNNITNQYAFRSTQGHVYNINQRPSTQSSYHIGDFRNFQIKSNERPLNHVPKTRQMLKQNTHEHGTSKSYSRSSNPPAYNSHHINTSNMTHHYGNTSIVACSDGFSLKNNQSLLVRSRQPSCQSVTSRELQTANPSFQQNPVPNVLGINTSGNCGGRGQVASITDAKVGSADPPHNASQGCERALLQRSGSQAIVVGHSKNIIGMPSPFNQNDSCASSMSGHSSVRAVAVVLPLSQEEHHSSAMAEPCKSMDNADKKCISPDMTLTAETTSGREDSNQNHVNSNRTASNNEVVLKISDLESESLNQTKHENHNSVVQSVSEISVNKICSGKKTKGVAPQSPPLHELSLLPTKSWTAESLTNLIVEMDKAQPMPKDRSEQSNIVNMVIMLWNKNIAAMLQSYKETSQTDYFSDIEKFCDAHIDQDTRILTEVSPDFKDQLQWYKILNDDEVYSEPLYKSLWLNVNHQLDDIDKVFGFPWTLRRNLYMDETKSQDNDVQAFKNLHELNSNEAGNEVLCQVIQSSHSTGSIGLTEESEWPLNPPASPQDMTETSSSDASYTFKIEVLSPEEAKIIFEHLHQNKECSDYEKETAVRCFEQRDGPIDMHLPINEPKPSYNRMDEICCLDRFIEVNSGLGKPSNKCQCRDKQSTNEGSIKILKPDPDRLQITQKDNCQTAPGNGPEPFSSRIIDLTDDPDDLLLSFFDKEPQPIFQTCSQSIDFGVNNLKILDICAEFSSPKGMHDLVSEEKESEENHAQEESSAILPLAVAVHSSDLMCQTQLTKPGPSESTETQESVSLFSLFNRQESHEQGLITSENHGESLSENKSETLISDVTHQTSLIHTVNNKGSKKKQKRQNSVDSYFPSRKKFKKYRLPLTSKTDHNSDAQHPTPKGKTVELVLFGAGQQKVGSPSEKEKCLVSEEYLRPPGVLSVKLDSFGKDTSTANPGSDYSVKQLIYEKWRKSIPTSSNSIAIRHKNKRRGQTSLAAIASFEGLKRQRTKIYPEQRLSDRTKKYVLSLKKRKALNDRRRHEEMKSRCYTVSLDPAERLQGSESGDDGIVLKFSVLPNTFNLKDGSTDSEEAAELDPDEMEHVEDEEQFPEKTATKLKATTWCLSEAKKHEPFIVSKNVGLFHEYQKKYKEKTTT